MHHKHLISLATDDGEQCIIDTNRSSRYGAL